MWRALGNVHYYADLVSLKGDSNVTAYVYPGRVGWLCGYLVMITDWKRFIYDDVYAFYQCRLALPNEANLVKQFSSTDENYPDWIEGFAEEILAGEGLGRWVWFPTVHAFFPAGSKPNELVLPEGQQVKWQIVPVVAEDAACPACGRTQYVNGFSLMVYDEDDRAQVVYTFKEPLDKRFDFYDLSYREGSYAIKTFGERGARALFDKGMEDMRKDFRVNFRVDCLIM